MVERLCKHAASMTDLAEPLGMRLPSALKHLKVLEDGGLVVSRKLGRVRTYEISPTAFNVLRDWIGRREVAMSKAFDRLEQAIAEYPEEKNE